MSSTKTAIYPNSRILQREGSTFLKKGRMKNIPIGVARPLLRGGDGGRGLILHMRLWLGFRRGVGGRINERPVCGKEDVLICSPKEHVAMGR
jgi:hypothetical protein